MIGFVFSFVFAVFLLVVFMWAVVFTLGRLLPDFAEKPKHLSDPKQNTIAYIFGGAVFLLIILLSSTS